MTCLSLAILLSSAVIMIVREKAGTAELALMFGSSGRLARSGDTDRMPDLAFRLLIG